MEKRIKITSKKKIHKTSTDKFSYFKTGLDTSLSLSTRYSPDNGVHTGSKEGLSLPKEAWPSVHRHTDPSSQGHDDTVQRPLLNMCEAGAAFTQVALSLLLLLSQQTNGLPMGGEGKRPLTRLCAFFSLEYPLLMSSCLGPGSLSFLFDPDLLKNKTSLFSVG